MWSICLVRKNTGYFYLIALKKTHMRTSLFLFIGMVIILACSNAAKTGVSASEERKRITSFILVKTCRFLL